MFFLFSCIIVCFVIFLIKIKKFSALFFCFFFYCFCVLNLRFNVRMFYFLCSRSLYRSSSSSSSNLLGFSKKSCDFLMSRLLSLSCPVFLVIFKRLEFFFLKLVSPTRSKIAPNSRSLTPLDVSYERFLYSSVSVNFGIKIFSPKNISSAQRN